MKELKHKKVLLIAPLGQYSESIQNTLEDFGAIVDSYEERPSRSFIVKSLIRYKRILIEKYIQKYFDNIIKETKNNNYDYVLMIRAEALTCKFILNLKEIHQNAKLILYQWDSMNYTKGPINKLNLFDKVFSFDKDDCKKYSLNFLPLFYMKEYEEIANIRKNINIDFLFIGTIHSDRYLFIKKIEDIAKVKGLSVFFYPFFTSHLGYYKMKYFDKLLGRASKDEFKFSPMTKKEVLRNVSFSNIIIDMEHPAQKGLTMRTIEALGAKRKLITTNKDIKNYDFYNENNILIVDRKNIRIPESFINSEMIELPVEIYQKYAIRNWVSTIFTKI